MRKGSIPCVIKKKKRKKHQFFVRNFGLCLKISYNFKEQSKCQICFQMFPKFGEGKRGGREEVLWWESKWQRYRTNLISTFFVSKSYQVQVEGL